MLSIVLQIHRNILSAQCYVRYIDDSSSVNTIQVECYSSELQLLFLMNDETVKKVKIVTPNDFFIPSSPSLDSNFSVKSDSIDVTPARQSVKKCSFRLQISGADKFDQSESELKVDVKDFFKKRFKISNYWNLFCASCGVGLPLEPMFIKCVREYSESELSEGWFCHGKGPQQPVRPSSQILYLDDTYFYLYPKPDLDIKFKVAPALDKKCCSNLGTDCQKDTCISVPSSGDCSDVLHSNLSGINCSSKSAGNCFNSENSDQSIAEDFNSFDVSANSFTHDQLNDCLTSLNLNCADGKNKNDLGAQISGHSVVPNINSCLKEAESSIKNFTHHIRNNSRHSAVDQNVYLNGSKCLYSPFECQSCGDVLTSEKSSAPFVQFYLDKLMFKNSSSNEDNLEYAHKITLLSFWTLVTKSQTSLLPSKLFLQSKVRGEELCLLLWIPSAPIGQFLLEDSMEDIPQEINLKTEPVYKVLYFIGTSHSENVRSWRHDFSVDFYSVSDTMVKTLCQILNTSSSHLPETSGAGGFSCGYLRLPS